jgi:hypothetical protein
MHGLAAKRQRLAEDAGTWTGAERVVVNAAGKRVENHQALTVIKQNSTLKSFTVVADETEVGKWSATVAWHQVSS